MSIIRLARIVTAAELPIIIAIAPALLFPTPRRLWVVAVLPALWAAARIGHGAFIPRTPLNIPLSLLLTMVAMSLFTTVDLTLSLVKVASLVLGVSLFWAVSRRMTTSSRVAGAIAAFLVVGAMLAVIALLGTQWETKFPVLDSITAQLPRAIRGLPGAEEGFNPNAVAGCLVLVLPLHGALLATGSYRQLFSLSGVGNFSHRWLAGIPVVTLVLTAGTFVLLQSRGAWLGLFGATVAFLLWHGRGTRFLVAGGTAIVVVLTATVGPVDIVSSAINRSGPGMAGSASGRIELWSRAVDAIQDVPFTGMGMNGFRKVMPVLYPSALATDLDVPHVHNQLLQVALDVGLAGLVAYMALWLVAGLLLVQVYQRATNPVHRATACGLGAGLVAHAVFGVGDAIALGTKLGVLFWLTLGIIVGLHRVSLTRPAG